ncbi:MAG: hypothetical protein HY272_06295 [Gammaproteobacteria bacterium]|nr:hypothetical protein [Gammaproteobacteria bacterium]
MIIFARNKGLVPALLAAGLLVSLQTAGATAPREHGAEVDNITVDLNKETDGGTLRAYGCKECPLELTVNSETIFYMDSKVINLNKVRDLSGRPGTVIYQKENKTVLKVMW